MKLASVLGPSDLPLAELSAARIDGELFAVDDAYSPIDVPTSRHARALAIAPYCHGRLIAEQRSAAWVWGARHEPPARHELCASLGARARPAYPIRSAVREVVIDNSQVAVVAGVLVTVPLRTIVDLARFSAHFDETDAAAVAKLAAEWSISLQQCRADMDARTNLPNKRRALERLATVL